MTATQLQLRRGSSTLINLQIPADGEAWVMQDRDNLMVLGDGVEFGGLPASPLPERHLTGYIAPDVTFPETRMFFSFGQFRGEKNDGDIRAPVDLQKDLNAVWQEGHQVGGFPSTLTGGVPAPNTTYHAFSLGKIRNGTGDIDAGFDSDLDALNLLTDASTYSYYRRRGSFLTDGSAQIRSFSQRGNVFLIDPVQVYSGGSPGSSLTTLSFVGVVPLGLRVRPLVTLNVANSTGSARQFQIYFNEKGSPTAEQLLFDFRVRETDHVFSNFDWLRVDTNGEMEWRATGWSGGSPTFTVTCHGWIDDELGVF